MDEMRKLLAKKKAENGEMDGTRRDAKMKVLGELRGIANDAIGRDLPSMKKVTVASPTEEGLQHGLSKAEDLIGSKSADMHDMADDMDDEEAENEEEAAEGEDMSHESESYQKVAMEAQSLSHEEKAKLIEQLAQDME